MGHSGIRLFIKNNVQAMSRDTFRRLFPIPTSTSALATASNWTEEMDGLQDVLISDLVRRLFCERTEELHWEEMPHLTIYRDEPQKRWNLIQTILQGDTKRRLNSKLLAILCWALGKEESAQIFARFIYAARNEQEQLANFLSVVLCVQPQLDQTPLLTGQFNTITLGIHCAVIHSREMGEELERWWTEDREPDSGHRLKWLLGGRLVENLLTLLRWQAEAEEGNPLRHLGISLADLRGDLHEGLFNWALDFVDAVRKRGAGQLDESSCQVLDYFFNLMRLIVPQVQLPLRFQNKLLTKICALFVALLQLVNRDHFGSPLDGIDYVCRCFAITGKLFTAQMGASKTFLLGALVDEVLSSASELFSSDAGHPSGGTHWEGSRDAGTSLDFSRFHTLDCLDTNPDREQSILKELRQMSLEEKSAAQVAHDGTLPRRKRHVPQRQGAKADSAQVSAQAEVAHVRKLLFLNMVDNLCMMPNSSAYDYEMCRYLGQLLVNRFAGDGLSSHSGWLDWETCERALCPQYLTIVRLLDECPLVFDLLMLLSDSGFQGICFALPLFKSCLAGVLIQLEGSPLKDEKLSVAHRKRLDRLFALLISADFFPDIIDICAQILSRVSNREASIVIRHLWNFLRLATQMKTAPADRMALGEKEGRQLISSMVLAAQRHITSLGEVVAPLVEQFGGEENEDDWNIERSVVAPLDIKRQSNNPQMT